MIILQIVPIEWCYIWHHSGLCSFSIKMTVHQWYHFFSKKFTRLYWSSIISVCSKLWIIIFSRKNEVTVRHAYVTCEKKFRSKTTNTVLIDGGSKSEDILVSEEKHGGKLEYFQERLSENCDLIMPSEKK